jgi:hypothetical protein
MKIVSFFFILLHLYLANAYPLFFKCNADGSVSNVLPAPELLHQLKSLANADLGRHNKNASLAAEEACEGAQNCIRDLVRLTELTRKAGELNREELIRKVEAKAKTLQDELTEGGEIQISEADHSDLAALNRANIMSYSCRAVVNDLDPSHFQSGKHCVVGHFNHSPYMYVTGERFSGAPDGELKNSGAVICRDIDFVVESAVAMGQDPFAALAISFMENGTRVGLLYLDPIGLIGELGCESNRVNAETANRWDQEKGPSLQNCYTNCKKQLDTFDCRKQCYTNYLRGAPFNLNSYETYYNVNFRAVNNSTLSNNIRKYIDNLAPNSLVNRSGFICDNGSSVTFQDQQKPGKCCLATNYMPADSIMTSNLSKYAKDALTYDSLKQYVAAPLPQNLRHADPRENSARRIQRFNGYSDLMGGAEGVSAWRSGVNYNTNPAYGYQAMDFMYNSLLTNPMIMSKIQNAQNKYGNFKSVMCADRPVGSFYTSSDYYSKKHAQSTRMDRILNSWNRGSRSFNNLLTREKNVLRGEFAVLCNNKLTMINLSQQLGFNADKFLSHCFSKNYEAMYPLYMENILPIRKTISQAAKMDLGYTWQPMNDNQFSNLLERRRHYNRLNRQPILKTN